MINVAVLYGLGINCDRETKFAIERTARGINTQVQVLRVHTNEFISGTRKLTNFQLLVFPGGFLHGDALGAGTILANKLRTNLHGELAKFVEDEKLILGICNGFQVLVKYPLLPSRTLQRVTLTFNDSGRFEDRWVWVKVNEEASPFLEGISHLYLPIRHAEGKFVAPTPVLDNLEENGQVAMKYCTEEGDAAQGKFPDNPNGSLRDIAGICDGTGRILGLMPHPEAFLSFTNRPNWEVLKRDTNMASKSGNGVQIFENALEFLRTR